MIEIINGNALDSLRLLEPSRFSTCVTSPPYWGLRDYGVEGQLGLEKTPDEYVEAMVAVFREVRRVLKDDGTLWLNIGDSYISSGGRGHQGKHGARATRTHTQRNILGNTSCDGLKVKDLAGIPWMLAFALRKDGWYLRQDIIWHKPNPMPESVTDRCTKAHEYIFLLSKSSKYYFSAAAIQEPSVDKRGPGNLKQVSHPNGERPGANANLRGSLHKIKAKDTRNKRSVWTVTSKPFKGAHFATFPPDLIEPCILAGCPEGGTVLDPFFGAGTTGLVAKKHNRSCVGIELNSDYVNLAKERVS